MRISRTVVLLTLTIALLSGCSSESPPDAQPENGSQNAFSSDETAQVAPDDLVSEAPLITQEQKEAALVVLQEINGSLTQDESGRAVALDLAGRRWADEAQVTLILKAFPEIESLTLEGRNLTDVLAPILASLENLETLALRETMIGEATFELLADDPKLKIIDVRVGAELNDVGINALAEISTLRAVRFVGCDLTDAALIKLIGDLPNLVEMDLRNSRGFTIRTMEAIQSKETLQTLKLGGPEINNDMIAPIASMPRLTNLMIEDGDIDDAGLLSLNGLRLRSLGLSGCLFVTDEGLAVLENCVDLQSLDLQDTGATLAALARLPNPEKLTSLNLNLTGIGDENIGELLRLINLQTLSMESTFITPEGVAQIKTALPECRVSGP